MSARKTAITCASAACLAMAVPAIKQYEGYAPTVVPDRLAAGLPTGGYGETEGVKLGETHDEKYWAARLAKRVAEEYDAGIGQCITVELPDGVRAMAISTSYNAGVQAVCSSPMVRKWNAGDIRGGCEAIRGWRVGSHPVKGGPLVVQRGLVNRRNSEAAKCLAGIEPPKPSVVAKVEAPKPYVCTPGQAERGECLPLVPKVEPVPVPVNPPIIASVPKPATCPAPEPKASFWASLRCWLFKCGGKA